MATWDDTRLGARVESGEDQLGGGPGHVVGAPSAVCILVLLAASMEGGGQLMGEEPGRPCPHSHLYPPWAALLAGVTGGLAAPLVAAGAATIIGSAGAAALGSVAGIAVMTSLFGAAGAGLTGTVQKPRWTVRGFQPGWPSSERPCLDSPQ